MKEPCVDFCPCEVDLLEVASPAPEAAFYPSQGNWAFSIPENRLPAWLLTRIRVSSQPLLLSPSPAVLQPKPPSACPPVSAKSPLISAHIPQPLKRQHAGSGDVEGARILFADSMQEINDLKAIYHFS